MAPFTDPGLIADVVAERAALRAQRDELLKALKLARNELYDCWADAAGTPYARFFAKLLGVCDAAIAKADGAANPVRHKANEVTAPSSAEAVEPQA